MTDKDILEVSNLTLKRNKEKYGVVDISQASDYTIRKISGFMRKLPLPCATINSLVKLGFYTREELEENKVSSISHSKDLSLKLTLARKCYNAGDLPQFNDYLRLATRILKNARGFDKVLSLETICLDVFDVNSIKNNLSNISKKLIACKTAIQENIFFKNNKKEYLQRFKQNKIRDITKNSTFEKACVELIIYLGTEKRGCLINADIYNFLEIRQYNIITISREFKKRRIYFLEKNI